MKTKLFRVLITVLSAAAVLIVPIQISTADIPKYADLGDSASIQQAAIIKAKEEVIYANLSSAGNVNAAYAVNHFEVEGAGSIADYGNYSSVTNLTNTETMMNDSGMVSFNAVEGDFYYQGDVTAVELPWIFDISYYLNGVKTEPQELAGKAGDIEIHIVSMQNEKVDSVFYENYMLQISITLDNEKCGDIKAPKATIASAGKNTVINFMVMPQKDADFILTTTAEDFSMDAIQISGMPLSMNIESPDTGDMLSDFKKLSDAISDLNDGVGELTDGVANIKKGANKLKSGSSDIKSGLAQLSGNSGQLVDASSQINAALSQISSSLSGALSGDMSFDDMTQLPLALSQISDGLNDISGGLTALKDGFSAAYAALDAAIQGIPDTTLTKNQINMLYANTDPSQYALLDDLISAYTAGQTVKGTYNSVKGAFNAVANTIDTLSGSIDTMADSLDVISNEVGESLSGMDIVQQLGQLSDGLSELAGNYADFNRGLSDYMSGVDDLADGYSSFHRGLARFADGTGELYDGVTELYDGTTELKDETADMPDTVQTEIDDMMDEYTGADFTPVSFMSTQNSNISLVQFVLKCDGINKPEETKNESVAPEQGEESIWDRFISLF